MSKIDTAKAKASWITAGLNDQGIAAIGSWIDKLAANIEAGAGRWDAYVEMAYYSGSDPIGSVQMLRIAADQTSK